MTLSFKLVEAVLPLLFSFILNFLRASELAVLGLEFPIEALDLLFEFGSALVPCSFSAVKILSLLLLSLPRLPLQYFHLLLHTLSSLFQESTLFLSLPLYFLKFGLQLLVLILLLFHLLVQPLYAVEDVFWTQHVQVQPAAVGGGLLGTGFAA